MTALAPQALAIALGVLVLAEGAYLFLRKRFPAFRPRLTYHLWALALATLAALAFAGLDLEARLGTKLLMAAVLVLSAVVLYALVEALVLLRPWNAELGPSMPKLARDVLGLVIVVAVALWAATAILDQPLAPLLVSSTVVSAVIGLALQDTLKNIFSGMALDLEKPFQPGDWLLIDGELRAQVIEMSWRSTHLRTKEGLDVYEPNANLSVSRLVNYGSGKRSVAFEIRIGLPYGAPPSEVKEILRQAAQSAPGVVHRPPTRVFVESFDDHAITYFLRVWTRRVGAVSRFRDGVNSRLWYALKRHGIDIPFPIRTVHMHAAPDMEKHRGEKALRKATELFSAVDIFRDLDLAIVRRLAGASVRRLFDTGETLVEEGAPGRSLFVLERGAVRVLKADPELGGKQVELAVLGEGAFFGEMSLLTGEPRSATIVAREHTGVLELGKEAMAAALEEDPRVAESLSEALARRQRDTAATLEGERGRAAAARAPADSKTLLRRIRTFFSLSRG